MNFPARRKRASFYGLIENMFEHVFIRFIFLIIALLAVVFVIRIFLISSLNTEYAERQILFFDLFYTPHSFSYADPVSGRVYPGVIDLVKFNNVQIDSAAFFTNNQHIAARFTLFDDNFRQLNSTATLNEHYFILKYPLTATQGAEGATLSRQELPITYVDSSKPGLWQRGTLVSEVLTGNS